MRISRFILATSAVVAALFFGGAYWSLDRVFDNIVRDNAARSSESAARITFAATHIIVGELREKAGHIKPQAFVG